MRSKTPPPSVASPPPHRLPSPIKRTPASASSHHTRCSPPSLFSTSPVARHWAPPLSSPVHHQPHLAIAPVTKARGKDRQDPLYLFLQPWQAPCHCIVDEPALRRSSGGVLSSDPPWTEAPPDLRVVDPIHQLFLLKTILFPINYENFTLSPPCSVEITN
jgi:hypothetical protein